MDSEAIFSASAAERRAFADVIETLTPAQLATPSLCGGWDVATVAAHLASAITTKIPSFIAMMIRTRSGFDGANDAVARRAAKQPIEVTLDVLRRNADSHFTPPGAGPIAPLTDVLVHSGDVQRPLGLPHDPPLDRVQAALGFLTGPRPIGFVKRGALAGLRVVADDVELDTGVGEELRGRGADVMMAVCGRTSALDLLSGPGVTTLRGRLAG